VTEVKGVEYLVHGGEVLPPGHPVVKARPELFEPAAEAGANKARARRPVE
jgi:hypothetical protein